MQRLGGKQVTMDMVVNLVREMKKGQLRIRAKSKMKYYIRPVVDHHQQIL
jgi:acyl-coenzyme A thioesterase PaaI-like protein